MFFKENTGLSSYVCAGDRFIVWYKLGKYAIRCIKYHCRLLEYKNVNYLPWKDLLYI